MWEKSWKAESCYQVSVISVFNFFKYLVNPYQIYTELPVD